MASAWQDEEEEITGINITPLVDVMLVLLIIFMVSANYIVTHALDLALPKSESGHALQQEEVTSLTFALSRTGQLSVNNEAISWEHVPEKIAQLQARLSPGQQLPQAMISADKDLPYGQVINLIDIIRKHGITDFAINVEAQEPQSPPN